MRSARLFGRALAAAIALAVTGCAAEQSADTAQETPVSTDRDELAKRLVFMAGHVEAGIALYRAGEGAEGGPHLLHPVSESYAEEREGLDAIGFDPAPFEAVSQALDAGRPAQEIEPQLAKVEANLADMRAAAGGETGALIEYLMDLAVEEYGVGVTDGAVTDAGEYQDAWGFAVVARQLAQDLPTEQRSEVMPELDALIALWPENAPTLPDNPASSEAISNQAERVKSRLP
ncbi:hypothetical protein [Erythrobacter ani]|uniref:DUF305 domain-containing protein n=1 Tax=Erythrobacter ani TaxID=2827235 RepID=A0ABS6SN35_9SPHN|nr:hypothetical protein [Erythrobacter ani]MBV7266415.1 hypothetical protein [Erythrobacter ani]